MNILKVTSRKRTIFFVLVDILLIAFSVWLAFFLRFEGEIPEKYFSLMGSFTVLAVVLILPIFYYFRLYHFTWSFVSISEISKLLQSLVISFLFIGAILFFLKDSAFSGFPRSVVLVSLFLIFLTCGGIRFSKRGLKELFKKPSARGKRTLIIGAGDAGEELARNILRGETPYKLVGFIDDNPVKQGVSIHGIKILGKRKDIPEIIKECSVEEIILAFPSMPSKIVRETVDVSRKAGIREIKIIPSIREIIEGKITLGNIRRLSVEDLLGRKPVSLDKTAIEKFLSQKRVLVTGAAGSIGRELCLQILKFNPEKLIALDQNETGIFRLERKLEKEFPNERRESYIADICDKSKIDFIFQKEKPEIIFHAAAYKHVPLMEKNPEEAVRNNVFGTEAVADAAIKHNAEKFVFISTDKAVNPTSIMGATKRTGEMICLFKNGLTPLDSEYLVGQAKFCAVRFGNVLDSQGNVIEIFKEQIKKGGPVGITNPEMKRYFMVTAEACLLVMEAGAKSEGGEIFVLNMGEPVNILDLAKEMIRLSGFEPDKDIPIVFTETRPGEKFFEELYSKNEVVQISQDIFVLKSQKIDKDNFERSLQGLKKAQENLERERIIEILKDFIPEYQPNR